MSRDSGFTLLEVLVATAIVAVAAGSLACVLSAAARVNGFARRSTYAALLAVQKMEQMRALPFGDPGLAISPADALQADAEGFHDVPAEGYRRRWLVVPLPSHPATAIVVHVLVWSPGDPGEATLVTVKSRKVD